MVPVGKTVPGAPSRVPPIDPWANDAPRNDEDRPRSRTGESARPRRARAIPPQPSGPAWPWFVGILGAFVVGGLLFSAFLVLVGYRQRTGIDPRQAIKQQQPPPQQLMVHGQRITAGQFDGNRAFLQEDVFQVKAHLDNNDPIDPNHFNNPRRKRYDIELIAFRPYVIEMESPQFDCRTRVEENGFLNREDGFPGQRNVTIFFTPQQNQIFTIYASSVDPANGPFTLTVRGMNRPKPQVP